LVAELGSATVGGVGPRQGNKDTDPGRG
jgi:hypothetical protein